MTKEEYEKFLNAVDMVCINCCEDTLSNENVCINCPVRRTCEKIESRILQDERCARLQEDYPDEPLDWKEFEEDIMGWNFR